jgi:ubiquinone/menaquinone biosynthesis C-methylase UbiE
MKHHQRKKRPAGDMPGTLGMDYARRRQGKGGFSYRLARRTREVLKTLRGHGPRPLARVLDLGAADGRMLEAMRRDIGGAACVGLEYSPDLAAHALASHPKLLVVRADMQRIPFGDESFDAVTAAAVIEHVPDPAAAMAEIRRVLRPGGLLALTAPAPFWESAASLLGEFGEEDHHHVMNLKQLAALARTAGLEVLEARKFMFSPVGAPGELGVERALRGLGLGCLMMNQLLAARRPLEPGRP